MTCCVGEESKKTDLEATVATRIQHLDAMTVRILHAETISGPTDEFT
jgi:hypothetical protein